MTGEQELAGTFAGDFQVVIDRLTGLLGHFESDRSPGLPLPDRCAICRISACSHILDAQGYDITATKLAVDCQIEHRQIASATFDLQFRPDRPDVLGAQRWFCPVNFPLFHGTRLGTRVSFSSSCMAISSARLQRARSL